jgi:hypothetical protein
MNHKVGRFNRRLALLVLASFMVFALAVVLRLGIGATPYNATDSADRPMGFNDPLHAEHYLIMLRNFSLKDFLKPEYIYEWILLAAHIVGAALLLSCGPACRRATRFFFVAQAVLFPFGVLAVPGLPFIAAEFFTSRMDREGFVDIPFIIAVTHPIWVVTSIIIAVALRGNGLGLARVWRAFIQATRAGAKTFTNEMHNI